MALAPDMRGVCSVGGTLVMTSNPTNMARTKTKIPMMSGSCMVFPQFAWAMASRILSWRTFPPWVTQLPSTISSSKSR